MFNKQVKFLAVLSFFIISFLASQAQPNQRAMLDSIAEKLMRDIRSNQDDRIYLHYDKPYYQAGTNIWFRVYLLKDLSGRISGNQNNIYVTLTNDNDSCISQAILNSVDRAWDGALTIPGKTPEGFYTIKAFTRHMATINSDKSFSAQIYILNRNSGIKNYSFPEAVEVSVKSDPLVRFYPEGGSLVNGIDNLVAFEVSDATGNPMAIQGRLIDDNQKTITNISSNKKGKGTMVFAPVKNRTYTAVVKSLAGDDLKFTLPPINYKACQLNVVSQDEKKIRLRVVLGDSLYAKKPVSFIVGVAKDRVCYAGIGNGMYETDVSLSSFPSGPATFYVFGENQTKQSERRVFIEKKDVQLLVQADKENYSPRQKVNLTLQLLDMEGKPLKSILSVSVTDDSLVEWPLQFAANKNLAGSDSVDLLKNLPVPLNPSINSPEPGDTGIILSGLITDRNGVLKEGQVINIFAEETNMLQTDTTDASGRFSFPPFNFTDQTPFFTQVTDLKGLNQDVLVTTDQLSFLLRQENNSSTLKWKSWPAELQKFRQSEADSILSGTFKNQLEVIANPETNSSKKVKVKVKERSESSTIITGERLEKLGKGNVVNGLLMLPGVTMVNGKLTIRSSKLFFIGEGYIEPLVIVNGVQVVFTNVAAYLNSIPIQNIDSIEIITGGEASIHGTRSANGVIRVKLIDNLRPEANVTQNGIQFIFPVGYQKKQSFYSPPYETNSVRETSFIDNRATIYWNGEIITDLQGKASFQFYTADSPSTYSIHIRGVSSKGDNIDESVKIKRGLF